MTTQREKAKQIAEVYYKNPVRCFEEGAAYGRKDAAKLALRLTQQYDSVPAWLDEFLRELEVDE